MIALKYRLFKAKALRNNFISSYNVRYFMKTKFTLLAILPLIIATSANAQNFWKTVPLNQAAEFTKGQPLFVDENFKPATYQLFSLDETALSTALKQSPLQKNVSISKSNFIVNIPMADGSIESFRIVESPVMSPALQAKHPNIRSYAGRGVNDPTLAIRFNFTPLGFHAIIISPAKNTVYINPVSTGKQLYVVFDRNNVEQEKQVFDCKLDQILNSNVQGTNKPFTTSDGNLRTYRFAVATGGEFSQLCLTGKETTDSAKKASVLSVLTTDLDRTNVIFETDFDIHLNYVDNEDTIIFLNGTSDPFLSNSSGIDSKWNTQSQHTIDSLIGADNYDIGHLLMGYSAGGNAGCIGCVCKDGKKGLGATGWKTHLTDDPFIVDYWDHEIGHQFGANHTFDYTFEGTGTQMEPGSGSTIMGYAGVTGSYDIQQHSDPYFHSVSIQQIDDYITNGKGATCASVSATGDAVPVVHAGKDYTIPKSTPFTLNATATDDDPNDILTYCWEQFDSYKNNGTSNAIPKTTSTSGPVFRSYLPLLTSDRTFPKIASILTGVNGNKWEQLPSVARILNFRVTVRDNAPGGGSTNSDDMAVTIDENSGPFKVTSPNTGIAVGSGSTSTVKWDVANTNAAPVNCSAVNILLSIDGGNTFPYLLAANTPNDGSKKVTFPIFLNTVSTARVKILASNNIFFDISDSNFSIEGALPLTWVSFTAEKTNAGGALLKWTAANEINNDHFEVERSSDGIHFNELSSVQNNSAIASAQNYSYTDVKLPLGTSYYRIKQVDKDGKYSYSKTAQVIATKDGVNWSALPNPATDHTTVLFNVSASNVHVYLTDNSGKTIYKTTIAATSEGYQLSIPLNNLAKGVYLLRVVAGSDVRTEKIIKD